MKLADMWLLQPAASLFASFAYTEINGAHQKQISLEDKEARKDTTGLDTSQLQYHFEDSPCSKTVHYIDTTTSEVSTELVNWIY